MCVMKGEIACQVKAYNKLKTTALQLPTNVNLVVVIVFIF